MADDQRDVVETLTHDHREVQEMFDELTGTTGPDERRRIVDDITIELVRHAVAEEMYLYPAVRRHVPDGDKLGQQVQTKKVAPTRPHPSAPDLPPLNKLLAPGAVLVDRIRDHLSGRGRD